MSDLDEVERLRFLRGAARARRRSKGLPHEDRGTLLRYADWLEQKAALYSRLPVAPETEQARHMIGRRFMQEGDGLTTFLVVGKGRGNLGGPFWVSEAESIEDLRKQFQVTSKELADSRKWHAKFDSSFHVT